MQTNEIYIEKLRVHQLHELSKFVVDQNFAHHENGPVSENYHELIDDIYREEKLFFKKSTYFVARDQFGQITGCIRLLKWDKIERLPLESIFGLKLIDCLHENHQAGVWHIGRFAIRKGHSPVELFKQLILCAISPVCEESDSVAYAECDSRLLNLLSKMGLDTEVMGKPVIYLGSETVPVCMRGSSLLKFHQKNYEKGRFKKKCFEM